MKASTIESLMALKFLNANGSGYTDGPSGGSSTGPGPVRSFPLTPCSGTISVSLSTNRRRLAAEVPGEHLLGIRGVRSGRRNVENSREVRWLKPRVLKSQSD